MRLCSKADLKLLVNCRCIYVPYANDIRSLKVGDIATNCGGYAYKVIDIFKNSFVAIPYNAEGPSFVISFHEAHNQRWRIIGHELQEKTKFVKGDNTEMKRNLDAFTKLIFGDGKLDDQEKIWAATYISSVTSVTLAKALEIIG